MLRIFHVSTLYRRISFANIRHYIVGALRRRCFPVGETTGRMISAPTWRMPSNFRSVIRRHRPCRGGYQPPANVANFWAETYWPGDVTMLQIYHVSTLYRRISPHNVRWCNCRRFAPTLFPHRGNNRADDIRPYMAYTTELPMQRFRCANEVLKDTRYWGHRERKSADRWLPALFLNIRTSQKLFRFRYLRQSGGRRGQPQYRASWRWYRPWGTGTWRRRTPECPAQPAASRWDRPSLQGRR